jgi:glycosyltransferase involved in cell wall biosynthesis
MFFNFNFEKPKITVIIAAYHRIFALKKTLKSLYKQSYTNWQAIVICDFCSSEFMSQVDRSDKRVKYINLPIRCGNQYGPNSIGLKLAKTEYIAYLNHDDLWLDDHLEIALKNLKLKKTDAYLGKAAFCHPKNQPGWPHNIERLLFSEVNRPEYLWRCIYGPNYFFEPVSSWVIRAQLAKKVGFWRPPNSTNLTPVMDWLSRLAIAGAQFSIGEKITVLKINLHHANEGGSSQYFEKEYIVSLLDRLLNLNSEQIRKEITNDLQSAKELNLVCREGTDRPLEMTELEKEKIYYFLYYLKTGINLNNLTKIEAEIDNRNSEALAALKARTGESIKRFPTINEILTSLSWKIEDYE